MAILLNSHKDVVVLPEQKGVTHAHAPSSICALVRLMKGCCSSTIPEICALVKNQCDLARSFAKRNAARDGSLRYVGNNVVILTPDVESLHY